MLGETVLSMLRKAYELDLSEFVAPRLRGIPLFEFMTAVILSQNTSDRNAIAAYQRLKRLCGGRITPEKIIKMDLNSIAEAIRIAGMHVQRARRLRELANAFIKNSFESKFNSLIGSMDIDELREILMELPGVGPKTADIILLMYYGLPTFPVDTHITRITWRLGYISSRNYESIRRWWMEITRPEHYLELHLLLIMHGRRVCRARSPLCDRCVLNSVCRRRLHG